MRDPRQGWRGGLPPTTPDWEGKEQHGRGARSVGEDPVQRCGTGRVAREGARGWVIAVGSGAAIGGRVRTWTVAHTELERERTRELARIGSNLNQIARWANTYREAADALEVVAHLPHRAGAGDADSRWGARAMMIKFLARGTGSAAVAADYLTREGSAEQDPEKNPKEVTVLRGNPDQVAAVADGLEFEHKYTSGVIAWAPEDNRAMRKLAGWWTSSRRPPGPDSNRTAMPGPRSQHREADGGVHVHVLAARCDLETGKSLNIAAPGWQKTFDALRDWQNHENGWSRPDDPERARDVQPGHRAYIEAAQLRAGIEAEKDPRRLITDYLKQGIESGAVSDRATMVDALKRAGFEVPRQGKDYITAADPESGGRWRLKGAIYEQDFQRERLASASPEDGRTGEARGRGNSAGRAQEALQHLSGIVGHALYTIESDTKTWSWRLSAAALKAWARPIVIGLLIFLGICVGSWGLTQWYAIQIHNLIERRDALTVQHNERRDAMRLQSERQQTLLDQTWGVWLHEAEDGTRYVVLPDGTMVDNINRWPHTVQGQRAVRLSNE